MKTIILHGENNLKSYERLIRFTEIAKKRNWEIADYSLEAISNQPLFGKERLFISRDYREINLLSLDKYSGNLVIYHEGGIPATFLKKLKGAKVEKFDLPKTIWNFLDNLSLRLLHEVLKTEPIEFVFALISKRLKDLYWVKIEPQTINYAPWQIAKLKKQSEKYSEEKIKEIIRRLSQIDIEVKTGQGDLLSSLDLLLVKHLE